MMSCTGRRRFSPLARISSNAPRTSSMPLRRAATSRGFGVAVVGRLGCGAGRRGVVACLNPQAALRAVLREHRYRRAGPVAHSQVRVGRTERDDLRGVARHRRRHRQALRCGRARPRGVKADSPRASQLGVGRVQHRIGGIRNRDASLLLDRPLRGAGTGSGAGARHDSAGRAASADTGALPHVVIRRGRGRCSALRSSAAHDRSASR